MCMTVPIALGVLTEQETERQVVKEMYDGLLISETPVVDGLHPAAADRVTLGSRARHAVHYSGPLRYAAFRCRDEGFAGDH